jgi:hypothetical protein
MLSKIMFVPICYLSQLLEGNYKKQTMNLWQFKKDFLAKKGMWIIKGTSSKINRSSLFGKE